MTAPLRALALVLLVAAAPSGRAEGRIAVDAALVLAVDVSGSMDVEELSIQRAGYVAALRHPDMMRIVAAGARGRIALAQFEWAGQVRSRSTLGWRIIDSAEAMHAFADAVEALPVSNSFGTSISAAIDYGVKLIASADFDADAWVIDVSGDGPNNMGGPVLEARDRAIAQGITINGLPIVLRPSRGTRNLTGYYEQCVIGGPGAFSMAAHGPEELEPAIRRKLFRELIGGDPGSIIRVADEPGVDCLIGEKARRGRQGSF